jgi:hypothetical protein
MMEWERQSQVACGVGTRPGDPEEVMIATWRGGGLLRCSVGRHGGATALA